MAWLTDVELSAWVVRETKYQTIDSHTDTACTFIAVGWIRELHNRHGSTPRASQKNSNHCNKYKQDDETQYSNHYSNDGRC